MAPTNHVLDEAPQLARLVVWAPLVVTLVGLLVAWHSTSLQRGPGARIAARRGPLWTFLYNKWFFDELYEATFVRAAKLLGDLFWKGGDQKIIDGLGPDGVSAVSWDVGGHRAAADRLRLPLRLRHAAGRRRAAVLRPLGLGPREVRA